MDLNSFTTPVYSPIPVGLYNVIAVLLAFLGFTSFAWFLMYERSNALRTETLSEGKKGFVKELQLALVASIFMGLTALFVLLAAGVYV